MITSATRIVGNLGASVRFHQAGELRIEVSNGKNLRRIGGSRTARTDPYLRILALPTNTAVPMATIDREGNEGQPNHDHNTGTNGNSLERRTAVVTSGGSDPVWNEVLTFPIVDQYLLSVECFDHDPITGFHEKMGGTVVARGNRYSGRDVDADTMVQGEHFSLLPVFRTGRIEREIHLIANDEFGTDVDAGSVEITLEFYGPKGVAFPRLQPLMASFDDSHRLKKYTVDDNDNNGRGKGYNENTSKFIAGDANLSQDMMSKLPTDNSGNNNDDNERDLCEFTEEEIRAGFKVVDVDGNDYIGVSDLRHILLGMGELVTDREIDAMISILDVNGDGQVSFSEFKAMVRSPDPANEDFSSGQEEKEGRMNEKDKEEIEKRNRKRIIFSRFVNINVICWDDIKSLLDYFRPEVVVREEKGNVGGNMNNEGIMSNGDWNGDINSICKLLSVEESVDTKEVFNLLVGNSNSNKTENVSKYSTNNTKEHRFYQQEQSSCSVIDTRELILGLVNFVTPPLSIEERCSLAFDLFDHSKTKERRLLSTFELEMLLAGNHMLSRGTVSRKARTLMECSDTDGSGSVCMRELVVAAKKFPNLLHPTHPTVEVR